MLIRILHPFGTLYTVCSGGEAAAMITRPRGSLYFTVVAVLAALHIVLSYFPPFFGFRRMSIALEPLEGIIAGPYLGFLAATIGWIGGRFVRPDGLWVENLFGIAEAVGALGAGFLISRRWYATAVVYGFLLLAFLGHPLAREIPLWTLWDTFLGFIAIFAAAFFVRKGGDKPNSRSFVPAIALIAFVSVELDVAVRVFMLIVAGLYRVYTTNTGLLAGIFVAGAFQTPLEAVYCILVSTLIGVPALVALQKGKILDWPLSTKFRHSQTQSISQNP